MKPEKPFLYVFFVSMLQVLFVRCDLSGAFSYAVFLSDYKIYESQIEYLKTQLLMCFFQHKSIVFAKPNSELICYSTKNVRKNISEKSQRRFDG